MKKSQMDPTEFLRDVAQHQMTVIVDDGVWRHLRFKRPGTSNMSFDILTWPGYLCYTGDMGTYVFSRVTDMFEFFRQEGDHRPNFAYWAEKVQASDAVDGIARYSPDLFRANVREWFEDHVKDNEVTETEAAQLWGEIKGEVLSHAEVQHEAFLAARDFETDGHRLFVDFWEVNCDVYTPRYEWCCYALPWAIRQYDAANTAPAHVEAGSRA